MKTISIDHTTIISNHSKCLMSPNIILCLPGGTHAVVCGRQSLLTVLQYFELQRLIFTNYELLLCGQQLIIHNSEFATRSRRPANI